MTTALRTLDQISVNRLKGVGTAMQQKLEKLGLETLQDLLFHLPLRYQDRTPDRTDRSTVPRG